MGRLQASAHPKGIGDMTQIAIAIGAVGFWWGVVALLIDRNRE